MTKLDLEEYGDGLSHVSEESKRVTGTKLTFSKELVEGYLNKIVDDDQRFDYFIIDEKDQRIVGEVVVNELDWDNNSGSLRVGIFKDEDMSKGYGTPAIIQMLRLMFMKENLNRVELQVYAFNSRAIHVYKKIGFTKEGVLRDYLLWDGKYYDAVVMSMLKREFEDKYGGQ
jgi:RimJ/RimL family protein N-acetyltransferase